MDPEARKHVGLCVQRLCSRSTKAGRPAAPACGRAAGPGQPWGLRAPGRLLQRLPHLPIGRSSPGPVSVGSQDHEARSWPGPLHLVGPAGCPLRAQPGHRALQALPGADPEPEKSGAANEEVKVSTKFHKVRTILAHRRLLALDSGPHFR